MTINTDSQIFSIYEVDRLSCGEWGSIEHLFVGSIWFAIFVIIERLDSHSKIWDWFVCIGKHFSIFFSLAQDTEI
jgi:hypothetical protein